jgi:hypothetical protein
MFGLVLGAQIGFLVHTIMVAITDEGTVWTLLISCLITMVIFGYLTHKYRRQMMVFAVSLTGMFLIMQGVAIIFGRFPTIF